MLEHNNCILLARTSKGIELRGILLHGTHRELIARIFLAEATVEASEVLSELKILKSSAIIYTGAGVIKQAMTLDHDVLCAIALDGDCGAWDLPEESQPRRLSDRYRDFSKDWRIFFRILPEFKSVVSEIQFYLTELKSWLANLESSEVFSGCSERAIEEMVAGGLEKPFLQSLDTQFDKFENAFRQVDLEWHSAHRNYARRHLHGLLLCAPFVYRTYFKPLGYAGDYEMVNMIVRNRYEGESIYAKLVHKWFTNQAPAAAHRNRVKHIGGRLIEEAARASAQRSRLRVLNLGCGPAAEIQDFLRNSVLSDLCDFTLYDFNDETVAYTRALLHDIKRDENRRTELTVIRKSVQQIVKERSRKVSRDALGLFDFIYCAGLFDYFSDAICRRILSVLYQLLAPGGLLLVTNVDHSTPRRYGMESILEWNLIYRNTDEFRRLLPLEVQEEAPVLHTEMSGVNLILEIRKPPHE